jgi:predicted Kef-type K+ transport protein
MHHVPLLVNITLALGYALLGGLAARRLGLPTIVGYLVAGVALGPFTPANSEVLSHAALARARSWSPCLTTRPA